MAETQISALIDPAEKVATFQGYPFHDAALTHFVGMSGIEDERGVVAAKLSRGDPRAGVFGYENVATADEITDGQSHTIMLIGAGNLAGPWMAAGGSTIRGAREPYFDSITGFGSASMPRGGALAVMADGSVRGISADIDPRVFAAMCTIHGHETVDLPPP